MFSLAIFYYYNTHTVHYFMAHWFYACLAPPIVVGVLLTRQSLDPEYKTTAFFQMHFIVLYSGQYGASHFGIFLLIKLYFYLFISYLFLLLIYFLFFFQILNFSLLNYFSAFFIFIFKSQVVVFYYYYYFQLFSDFSFYFSITYFFRLFYFNF